MLPIKTNKLNTYHELLEEIHGIRIGKYFKKEAKFANSAQFEPKIV